MGDIPADDEALWTQAVGNRKPSSRGRTRRGVVGPESLRKCSGQGKSLEVHALAREMQTGADGTSLRQLAAWRSAWPGGGGRGTDAGRVGEAGIALIALLKPGHYVLVERVSGQGVRVWNPDAEGTGRAGTKTYTLAEWQGVWSGIALSVER